MDLANQVIPKKLATCVFISNNQAESDIQSYLSHLSLQERKAILNVLQKEKELRNETSINLDLHRKDLQIIQEHSIPQHCDKGKELKITAHIMRVIKIYLFLYFVSSICYRNYRLSQVR